MTDHKGIKDLRSDLTRIQDYKNIVKPIERTLNKIEFDKRLTGDAYNIQGILDFSELYRYLHPVLDRSAYYNKDAFAAEQFALQSLFTSPPFGLFFIGLYRREYLWTIEGAHEQLVTFAQQTDERIKLRIIKWDERSARILNNRKSLLKLGSELTKRKAAVEDLLLLDILFNNARTEIFRKGLDQFKELLSKNIIVPVTRIDDFDIENYDPGQDEEYLQFLDVLNNLRPGRKHTNDTDAQAFHLVQQLNRRFFGQKKCFLFITSSPKLIEGFDSEYALNNVVDQELLRTMDRVSVMRTPQYFLLRFLLESSDQTQEKFNYETFQQLVRRYVSVAERIEHYFDPKLDELLIIDIDFQSDVQLAKSLMNQLAPMISLLNRFGTDDKVGNSLYTQLSERLQIPNVLENDKLNEESIRSTINKFLENPRQIVKDCARNAKELSGHITTLEISIVDLIYEPQKSDFIYSMQTSETTDTYLQEKVNRTLNELRKHQKQGVKQAIKELGGLRERYVNRYDLDILTSKVYRAMRSYRAAVEYALLAEKKAPNSIEVQFELCVCYRQLAMTREDKRHMLAAAWEHCERALQVDTADSRVMKEKAMLIWAGSFREPKLWILPNSFTDDEAKDACIDLCTKALDTILTQKKETMDPILQVSIKNDLAYYLACRAKGEDLDEAKKHIDNVLENDLLLLQKEGLAIPMGAFSDTRGFIYLKMYQQTRNTDYLYRAGDDLKKGHDEDKKNPIRSQNFLKWAELMHEAKALVSGLNLSNNAEGKSV
jgi:hypothetical protein